MTHPEKQGLDIAIIGGGASGTLTAVHLLREAASQALPLHITMIDQHGRHGLGQAYSTDNRAHLLNAMAGQMSAIHGEPDHLIRWAAADISNADGDATTGGELARTAFLARRDYGRYLCSTLADAERQAFPVARLTRDTSEILAVRPGNSRPALHLITPGGQIAADLVVLATGNAPSRMPVDVPASDRIVTDPWQPGALAGLAAHDEPGTRRGAVVIVGTGLTMLDLAVTIAAADPHAVIHAISRHGLLPRPHPGGQPTSRRPPWLPVLARTSGPVRLTDLMWQVRSTIATRPAAWFDVMDALRPLVPTLWQRLPVHDKRLFLSHVARYWEVHRHLAPPATASRITALRATGRLHVHRGRIAAVTQQADRLRIAAATVDGNLTLDADWLVNSTGATTDIASTASPLVHDLFASGLARPDPMGLGIDAEPDGRVLSRAGIPSDVLLTLGPPLRGVWYETTAIPEIRAQAAGLAERITRDHLVRQRPGSAA
jgi:uncharacterized NAD(P)/FAD-binding protein YdhS